jgi:hypothetical protein
MVGATTTDLCSGLVGLESVRLLLLCAESVSTPVLGLVGNDFEDWGRCGADFVLLRGFISCKDTPLRCVDSGLDVVRLRVRGC